jgi:hypothetical protein
MLLREDEVKGGGGRSGLSLVLAGRDTQPAQRETTYEKQTGVE